MEQRVVKIDLLDYLFSNVGVFAQLDVPGKRKIFNSRPQPVFDAVLDVVDDKRYVTRFDPKYYSDFPWMTACPKRKVLFCYVCLLQGRTVESVICARADVVAAAQAHEMTAAHMTSHDACLSSVAAPAPDVKKQAQQLAQKKKSLLGKLVQILYVLKCQNYFEKIGKSREFSFKTVDFLALNGLHFSSDWESFFPEIVKDPKKEASLFSIFRALVVEHIKRELSQTDFVSLQIEDVSEYIAKPTISVSFRYILNDKIYERFGGFYELIDFGCKIDDGTLIDILQYWEIGSKLIGISTDFHLERIPTSVPDRPFQLFNVCSTNYKMNYVVVKIASVHRDVREFLGKIQNVVSFLSDVVNDVYVKNDETTQAINVPDKLKTKDLTIDEHILTIYRHIKELTDLMNVLRRNVNISLHLFLLNKVEKVLKDPFFVFYAGFFSKLLEIGNDMSEVLIRSYGDDVNVVKLGVLTRIQELTGTLGQLNETNAPKKNAESKFLNHRIIAAILKDFDLRDKNQTNFAIGKLFSLNQNRGKSDQSEAAKSILDSILSQMKGLIDFNLARLRVEVQQIFKDPSKALPPGKLFEKLVTTGSIVVYPEFAKLLKFHLTLPTSSIDDNQTGSTYRRIKTFCRVTRGVGDFFDLDYLFVENDLSMELAATQNFLGLVVNQFAKSEGLRDLTTDHDVI
uniref:Lipoyl synthase n=1 Tax=Lygus hesperus TaxID=30085 RepID=A0A0A9Y3F1_LYGHE